MALIVGYVLSFNFISFGSKNSHNQKKKCITFTEKYKYNINIYLNNIRYYIHLNFHYPLLLPLFT